MFYLRSTRKHKLMVPEILVNSQNMRNFEGTKKNTRKMSLSAEITSATRIIGGPVAET
jgi:hypothetical protein